MVDRESDEELGSSRYAVLLQTEDGYEVRRQGRGAIEIYPSTDEGFDAAWDRFVELTHAGRTGRFLSALMIIAAVDAVLWFVVVLVTSVLYVALIHSRRDDPLGGLLGWLSPFTTVFYSVFAGAVGLYAVVWLSRRGMPPVPRRRR
jgi:hypothetical protein